MKMPKVAKPKSQLEFIGGRGRTGYIVTLRNGRKFHFLAASLRSAWTFACRKFKTEVKTVDWDGRD